MLDLKKALADLGDVRQHMAAGTLFRGFGPAVLAFSGLLAFATATLQAAWFNEVARDPSMYFGAWIGTAIVACALIGLEILARTRRLHAGLADELIINVLLGSGN